MNFTPGKKSSVQIKETDVSYEVAIPPLKKGRILLLAIAGLLSIFFVLLLPTVLSAYSPRIPGPDHPFTVFLAKAALYGVIPFMTIIILLSLFLILNLWAFLGKERFIIRPGEIILAKTLFGLGRKNHFDPAHISNIAFVPMTKTKDIGSRNPTYQSRGVHEGKITFNYGPQVYSFGRAVDDGEAAALADVFEEKIREAVLAPDFSSGSST
ncbi:MAG: hypothetical protein K9L75_04960 [Spirochaetia bacterium]|nr:hypothetical protein [Spirochaetia bacterium]